MVRSLLERDPYMLCADIQPYLDCQAEVGRTYLDQKRWTRMSILNSARAGKFSSDRAIQEYCRRIWQVEPVKVTLPAARK
jgi:starch phosphorylase